MKTLPSVVSLCDYRTTVVRNKRARNATSLYVTANQRKELIENLDDSCCIVFTYYMEKACVDGFNFDDIRVAKALGYTERKVRRARQKLARFGWFKQAMYKHSSGRKLIITFLGKTAVSNYDKDGEFLHLIQADFLGSTETHLR